MNLGNFFNGLTTKRGDRVAIRGVTVTEPKLCYFNADENPVWPRH